ncbi:Dpp4p [Mycoemilia scoparia]|uniref:Dpp4p n=1 Tax=Mycoemilia scoparia TaxID=417184 RepID=A0A9W8DUG2_9FUNG|nr:Dpp4p [Mycoemilia scoparia]
MHSGGPRSSAGGSNSEYSAFTVRTESDDEQTELSYGNNNFSQRLMHNGSNEALQSGNSVEDQGASKEHKKSWTQRRFSVQHILFIILANTTIFLAIGGIFMVYQRVAIPFAVQEKSESKQSIGRNLTEPCFTYEGVLRGEYFPNVGSMDWIAHPTDSNIDGLQIERLIGTIMISSISDSNWFRILANKEDLNSAFGGKDFSYNSYKVSPDWEFILFETNHKKIWRHSYTSEYYVYNIKSKALKLLTTYKSDKVQMAQWAPKGHKISFVIENNLYLSDTETIIQVTDTGSPSVFNGVSDWIYEEEVLEDSLAHWWSPDAESIAYLSLNDTDVPIFTYSLYHAENHTNVYPEDIKLHYPKAGYTNPTVAVYVYHPDFKSQQPKSEFNHIEAFHNTAAGKAPMQVAIPEPRFNSDDVFVTQVTWTTTTHSNLLIRTMNRVQDHMRVYLSKIDGPESQNTGVHTTMTREWNTNEKDGDGSWIDTTHQLTYVEPNTSLGLPEGYIDFVQNGDYLHLGYFTPLSAAVPKVFLTNGTWDVLDNTVSIDSKKGLLYYSSTANSSTQKNTYSIRLSDIIAVSTHGSLETPVSQPITQGHWNVLDESIKKQGQRDGSYTTSLSPGGNYIFVSYNGPSYPWSVVRRVDPSTLRVDPNFEKVISKNTDLAKKYASCGLPTVRYTTIKVGDYELNAKEIRPPNFDENAKNKYGVLFQVYGGPNSQLVTQDYSSDWHNAIAAQTSEPDMPFIVMVVDGRGTAHKGRSFRTVISRQLGTVEAQDQIKAAKYMQSLPYVNPDRIAIWGWSFGGHLTLRCLEAAPEVFKVGMSVAPVTNWRLYDSAYTERYLKTPQMNPHGYDDTRIHNYSSFHKTRLLIQHGTGDDNVHFQNTLDFVDRLQNANVKTFDMAVYTDSDHSIYTDNARSILYNRLTKFLFSSFKEIEAGSSSQK